MEIDIGEALKRSDLFFIDVRSPHEFKAASIPGALNIPLFDDRDHHQLGIIYHQLGEMEARLAALEKVAPRLPLLVDRIVTASTGKPPLLYCQRGGMRSLSLCEVLRLTGIRALRLKKGYKAYRSYINKKLKNYKLNNKLFVLHGLTGVGKTAVLQILAEKGCSIIDLEGMANHRGSVFGAIGFSVNRSQKDFDALLLQELDNYAEENNIIIEGEGRRIGNIYLPPFLTEAMKSGFQILLNAPLETRVNRIVETYIPTAVDDKLLQELKSALENLRKRLGSKKTDQLLVMLNDGQYHNIARLMCAEYYDLFYSDSRPECSQFDVVVDAQNLELAADEIIKIVGKLSPAGNQNKKTIHQNV